MPHFIDYPEDHYQEPEPCPAWCIIPREPGEAPDEHVHTAARRGVACVELWRQRRYVAGNGYGGSRGSGGSAWSGSGTSSGLSSSSASLSSVGDGHTSKTAGAGSTSDKADGSSASTGDDGISAGGMAGIKQDRCGGVTGRCSKS